VFIAFKYFRKNDVYKSDSSYLLQLALLTMFMYCCQWASSSVYYLLGLWSRLVTSVPYLKGDAPSLLDEFVPKITEGFITSRFNSVQV
jgi:hypothetical protein